MVQVPEELYLKRLANMHPALILNIVQITYPPFVGAANIVETFAVKDAPLVGKWDSWIEYILKLVERGERWEENSGTIVWVSYSLVCLNGIEEQLRKANYSRKLSETSKNSS
jgi:hypothetical protein